MKILETKYYYHRSEDKTKKDIRDIGRVLRIFKDDAYFPTGSVLYTWVKTYDNDSVIIDVVDIAQMLKVIKGKYDLDWRRAIK